MKIFTLYRLVRCIAISHIIVVLSLMETIGTAEGADLKTKLILQNIRTRLAQKVEEIVKKKECESGLILCKDQKSKGVEDKSEEILPPPKVAGSHHKPIIKINPKEVTQSLLPKAPRKPFRKFRKTEETESSPSFFHPIKTPEKSEEDETTEKPEKEKTVKKDPPTVKKDFPKQTAKIEPRKTPDVPTPPKKPLKVVEVEEISKKKERVKELKIDKKPVPEMIRSTKIKEEKKATVKAQKRESVSSGFVFPGGAFLFALDSHGSSPSACEKHSQIYLKQLKKYDIWALMMFDASGKLASGILQGNVNQFGDFDECLSINAVFKKSKKKSKSYSGIKGKYCLATIDITTDEENKSLRKARDRAESYQFIRSNINDPGHFIPRFSTVNWGVCVPSACLAEDVEKFLKSQLEDFYNTSKIKFDVKIDEENCVVRDDLQFQFHEGTIITISFYLIVLIASLYATFIDMKSSQTNEDLGTNTETQKPAGDEPNDSFQDKARNLVMAFSLKKNFEKLVSSKSEGSIECINGIKSIFTLMLYFAHKTIPLGMTPFTNRVLLTKISNQPATVLLRASIIYTDGFLLISGVLTSYNLAKEMSAKKKISWIKKSAGRFIRLTPALLAVILFYGYIWDQLGSGPLWNLVVNKNSLLCRKYMWRNTLYIQNFFAFEDMCAPQTHQLALDMQLSLMAPLLVYLMHTYDKTGTGILQALFFFSSIMRYITTSNNNLSVVIYHGMPVSQLYETANLLYTQTIHRASPYILGTVVGYHLKKFEKNCNIPKSLVAFCWFLALVLGYYSLVSPYRFAFRTFKYEVEEAAQYSALLPIAWSLTLSWIIIACHMGFGGKLNEFLCQKILLVFSRISYSVYLTQFLVFFYKVGVKRVPELFTISDNINIGEFFLVIIISVIVTLFFDIPMMEIKRIILDSKRSPLPPAEEPPIPEPIFETENEVEHKLYKEDSQESTDYPIEGAEEEYEEEDVEYTKENVDYEEEEEPEYTKENADDEEENDISEEEIEETDEAYDTGTLRRSTRMHFDEEPDDKECYKEEEDDKEK